MPDTQLRRTQLTAIKDSLVKPTIRLGLAIVVLFAARFILVRVPGTDFMLLEPNLSVGVLLYGIITLVIMAVLFDYASTVGGVLREESGGPKEVKRAIQLATLLLLLVWAYPTFTWLPYFDTHPGQYDLLFLVLGIVAGGWLAALLYTNVDEFTDYLADKLTTATTSRSEQRRDADDLDAQPPAEADTHPNPSDTPDDSP